MVAGRLTLFMVEFQPGGEGNIHDHPFEESYFLLRLKQSWTAKHIL